MNFHFFFCMRHNIYMYALLGEFVVHCFECTHESITVPQRLRLHDLESIFGKRNKGNREVSTEKGLHDDSTPSVALLTFCNALTRLHSYNISRTKYQSLRRRPH